MNATGIGSESRLELVEQEIRELEEQRRDVVPFLDEWVAQ